jgi:hypothetical protein
MRLLSKGKIRSGHHASAVRKSKAIKEFTQKMVEESRQKKKK